MRIFMIAVCLFFSSPPELLWKCVLCNNPVPSTASVARSNGSTSSLLESLDGKSESCEGHIFVQPMFVSCLEKKEFLDACRKNIDRKRSMTKKSVWFKVVVMVWCYLFVVLFFFVKLLLSFAAGPVFPLIRRTRKRFGNESKFEMGVAEVCNVD